jgi:hypothetical protein
MVLERTTTSDDNKEQTFGLNGINFKINIDEFKDFLKHCSSFMDISKEGFDTMLGSISDAIIDNENQNTTIEEIRPQLKFLREINFYLKSIYDFDKTK